MRSDVARSEYNVRRPEPLISPANQVVLTLELMLSVLLRIRKKIMLRFQWKSLLRFITIMKLWYRNYTAL